MIDYESTRTGSGPGPFRDMFSTGQVKFTLQPSMSLGWYEKATESCVIYNPEGNNSILNYAMNSITEGSRTSLQANLATGKYFGGAAYPAIGPWTNYSVGTNNCGHFAISALEHFFDRDLMPMNRNKGFIGPKFLTPQMSKDAIRSKLGSLVDCQ